VLLVVQRHKAGHQAMQQSATSLPQTLSTGLLGSTHGRCVECSTDYHRPWGLCPCGHATHNHWQCLMSHEKQLPRDRKTPTTMLS